MNQAPESVYFQGVLVEFGSIYWQRHIAVHSRKLLDFAVFQCDSFNQGSNKKTNSIRINCLSLDPPMTLAYCLLG